MKLLSLIMIALLSSSTGILAADIDEVKKSGLQADFKTSGLEEHAIIDPHLHAYNNNDYEKFKALFHDEIEAYEFPDKLLFRGKDEFDETYSSLVADIDKFAFISERIVEGSFVVDMESVKIQVPESGEQVIEGLVIYQIKDSLIYRMMFLKEK